MNEQTVQLIEQLAQKLGTTAEYLWAALIRQAPITATTNLLWFLSMLIGGFFLLKLHKRLLKEDERGRNTYSDGEGGWEVLMGILTGLWIIVFLVSFFLLGSVITGFLNPEYWALKQIID